MTKTKDIDETLHVTRPALDVENHEQNEQELLTAAKDEGRLRRFMKLFFHKTIEVKD